MVLFAASLGPSCRISIGLETVGRVVRWIAQSRNALSSSLLGEHEYVSSASPSESEMWPYLSSSENTATKSFLKNVWASLLLLRWSGSSPCLWASVLDLTLHCWLTKSAKCLLIASGISEDEPESMLSNFWHSSRDSTGSLGETIDVDSGMLVYLVEWVHTDQLLQESLLDFWGRLEPYVKCDIKVALLSPHSIPTMFLECESKIKTAPLQVWGSGRSQCQNGVFVNSFQGFFK